MAGLFSNDQDILSNIIKERQAANTALGSPYGKYAGIVSTGASLADRAADAMSGGMLGGSDPRMQQQQEIKKIFSDVATQAGSTSSPEFYKALAQALQQKYPEQAQKAMDKAREIEESTKKGELTDLQIKEAKNKLNEAKAEKDAAAKSVQTRTNAINALFPDTAPEVRDAIANDKDLFKTTITEKLKAKDIKTDITEANGRVLLIRTDTGETIKDLGSAADKGVKVTVPIDLSNKQGGAFAEQRGKDQAKWLQDALNEKKKAGLALKTLDGMEKTNVSGIYSGPQAQIVLSTNNFLESVGLLNKADTKKLTNSVSYDKLAKDLVMQDLDGKLGAQVSDADRKYVEARIPQLTTNPQARSELIAKLKEINNRKIAYADQMNDFANNNQNLNKFVFKDPYETKKERAIVKTGVDKASGRRVVQYSDGSVEYAD